MTEHHRCFINNAGLCHFHVKVITFTSTFPNACEYGDTAMLLGNVINQLLNCYGFTYTGTTEETNLTALSIRSEQVDNFNSSFQNLGLCRQILEFRRFAVDWISKFCCYSALVVDRFTKYVKYPAKRRFTNRNRNWSSQIYCICSAYESVCRGHCDTTNQIITQMIGCFQNQIGRTLLLYFNSVENFR
ncbi:hypothetical protein D3C81_764580 [compost metagenome]